MEFEVDLNFKMTDPERHEALGEVFAELLANKVIEVGWLYDQLESRAFPIDRAALSAATFADLFGGITRVTTKKSKVNVVTMMGSQCEQVIPSFMHFLVGLGAKPLLCKAVGDETVGKFKMAKSGVKVSSESRWDPDDGDDTRPHSGVLIDALFRKYAPVKIDLTSMLGLWQQVASCEYIEEDEDSLHFSQLPIPTELFIEARDGRTRITYNAGHDHENVGPFETEAQYQVDGDVLTLESCGRGIASRECKVTDVAYQAYGEYLLTKHIITPDIYSVSVLKRAQ